MDKICYCEISHPETIINVLKQLNRNFIIITDKKDKYKPRKSKAVEIDTHKSAYLKNKQKQIFTALDLGKNIVSHSPILTYFNVDILKLCKEKSYALVIDIDSGKGKFKPEIIKFTEWDISLLTSEYLEPLVDNRFVRWRKDKSDYVKPYGVFSEFKNYCDLEGMFLFNGEMFKIAFPYRAMKAFSNIIEIDSDYDYREYCIGEDKLRSMSLDISGLSLNRIRFRELLKRFKIENLQSNSAENI